MAAVIVLAVGCGGGSVGAGDPPAKPPAGWRTVRNPQAGFSIAAPRSWLAATRRRATLLRSPDRLVALTVAGDRSMLGRDTPAAQYARDTLEALPDFEGSARVRTVSVRGSPYNSARLEGAGRVRSGRTIQGISVAAFHLSGKATFAVIVFRNLGAVPGDARTVDRMLASLRVG
jgi:hypothetical protein